MTSINIDELLELLRPHMDGWSDGQIIKQILDSIQQKCFAYSVDENNKINSIVLAKWHDSCCIHIIQIVGDKGSLKKMIKYLRQVHPEVKTLTAFRYKKPVTYNVDRLKLIW